MLFISPLDFHSDDIKGFRGGSGERLLLRKMGFYITGIPGCQQGVYFLIHWFCWNFVIQKSPRGFPNGPEIPGVIALQWTCESEIHLAFSLTCSGSFTNCIWIFLSITFKVQQEITIRGFILRDPVYWHLLWNMTPTLSILGQIWDPLHIPVVPGEDPI